MTDSAMDPAVKQGFRFSTAGMPLRAAFDLYRSVFASGAEAGLDGERFRGELSARRFARMVVHERRLHDVRHVRTAAQVRRTDFSHFTLTLCLDGRVTGRSGDDCVAVGPGELLLLDMRHPVTLRMTDAHVLTVAVAREVVEAAAGDPRRQHARVFDTDTAAPLRRYLSDLLVTPDEQAVAVDGPLPVEQLADQLGDMLSPEAAESDARARAGKLLAAHRVIEERIEDPEFGVVALARAVGVSRAGLYRLFEPLGGVGRHLLDRRLARFHRLLTVPGPRASLATLVDRSGLVSESHASRIFRERFGARPGAYHRLVTGMTDGELAATAMRSWADDLR